jgi:hypothetical protein
MGRRHLSAHNHVPQANGAGEYDRGRRTLISSFLLCFTPPRVVYFALTFLGHISLQPSSNRNTRSLPRLSDYDDDESTLSFTGHRQFKFVIIRLAGEEEIDSKLTQAFGLEPDQEVQM